MVAYRNVYDVLTGKRFSSGTLYAQLKQTGTENGGSGDLQWINLGMQRIKK